MVTSAFGFKLCSIDMNYKDGEDDQSATTCDKSEERLRREKRLRELQVLESELSSMKRGARLYVQQQNSLVCFREDIPRTRAVLKKEFVTLQNQKN